MRFIIACLLLLAASSTLADEVTDSRRLAREAAAAYNAKNYALFLEKARAASEMRPQHPTLLYNFASALALNGRGDDALAALERVAAMGVVVQPEKDDDFASIRNSARFTQLLDAFRRNARPVGKTSSAFTLDKRGIISEGLAYDPSTKRFFVSSVHNGAIYSRDRRGRVKTLIDKQWGIFGMAVDAKRRRLWAATSAIAQNTGFRTEDKDHAAVLEIGLDSGKLIRSIMPPDQDRHLFGDVAVAEDGSVFVSDSVSPSIYVIRNGAMEPFLRSGPFTSLQGLVPAGKVLYAADYSKGIFAIDMTTRDAHPLPTPQNTSLLGIDGLYAAGKSVLIGTQNGTTPQRVVKLTLTKDGLAIDRTDILASAEPAFDDITLGVVARDAFYFNASSQWGVFVDSDKQPDPGTLKPAIVLAVPFSR